MNVRSILSLGAAALVFTGPLQAVVDDAHSACMSAAQEPVKAGFKVRREYWNGTVKSGEQRAVKHQLFKGNDYWFWLGTSTEEVKLSVEVFDADGKKLEVETKDFGDAKGIHFQPPKTGTYVVVIKLSGKDGEEIDWALAYAYK